MKAQPEENAGVEINLGPEDTGPGEKEASSSARTVLLPVEGAKRLSESVIWKSQRAFYKEKAVRAWSESIVPHFASSNAYLANCYARLILAYARDLEQSGAPAEDAVSRPPINIVEIGAGAGKFGFLILVKLLKMQHVWPWENCFRYVLTDFVQETVDYWSQHPALQKFYHMGILDYGVFDAETDTEIQLQRSGEVLNSKYFAENEGSLGVMVSNYVFDSLRQDAFCITNGELQENLCSVFSTETEPYPESPELIQRMQLMWSSRKCDLEYYQGKDNGFNKILEAYVGHHREAKFLLPIGGLSCIENVKKMTNNKFLWLAGDKAHTQDIEIADAKDPHVAIHGSFSFMSNFHACKIHIEQGLESAFSLLTSHLQGFKCCAMVVGSAKEAHRGLRLQWHSLMEAYNPEDFSSFQRCVKEEVKTPSLKTALCTTRLAHWDPDVFIKFKSVWIDKTPFASEKEKADVYHDAMQVWNCHYQLDPSIDVAFELGRVMMGLRKYNEAIQFFEESTTQCGEHHVTSYNIGICQSYINQVEPSIAAFKRSLAMKPTYADAQKWLAKMMQVQSQANSIIVGEETPASPPQSTTATKLRVPAEVQRPPSSQQEWQGHSNAGMSGVIHHV